MTKILAINGSYRDDGITDQAVAAMAQATRSAGAEVEIILLREYPIEFCLNCRARRHPLYRSDRQRTSSEVSGAGAGKDQRLGW